MHSVHHTSRTQVALVCALFALAIGGCSDDCIRQRVEPPTEISLENADSFPMGLEVIISPDSVAAIVYGPSMDEYTWIYDASVSSIEDTVTVVEYGIYCETGDEWQLCTQQGTALPATTFASQYSCPGAVLKPGATYTDERIWHGASALQEWRVKWVFVGRHADGHGVRGERIVKLQQSCPEEDIGPPDLSGVTFLAWTCATALESHCREIYVHSVPLATARGFSTYYGDTLGTPIRVDLELPSNDQWVIHRLLANWNNYV